MTFEHVIFDYDGTCTEIPTIVDSFLRSYLHELNQRYFPQDPVSDVKWSDVLASVREASPDAGWTIGTTSSAPAAADPYIQAFEAAQILRRRAQRPEEIPREVFEEADKVSSPPLRPELKDVLLFLNDKGARVTFISNSSPRKIRPRLEGLFGGALPDFLRVQPGALKFNITEPALGDTTMSSAFRALFLSLPAAVSPSGLARPVYLRRANYAGAISQALGGDVDMLHRTLFCGDIWEMDLAMPFHLGASVHLVTRAAPFMTYPYEHAQVALAAGRARTSDDLNGLRAWF